MIQQTMNGVYCILTLSFDLQYNSMHIVRTGTYMYTENLKRPETVISITQRISKKIHCKNDWNLKNEEFVTKNIEEI